MISNKYILVATARFTLYTVDRLFRLITIYTTLLVLVFGVGESGKLSALSSACRTSSNDWPRFFLSFSSLKCLNIASILIFQFFQIWCSANSGVLDEDDLEPSQLVQVDVWKLCAVLNQAMTLNDAF